MMSFEDSHAVGPFGVPYRTTPPRRKAPNKQLQAVFLRLSPSNGLTHARIHSPHTPRTRPAPIVLTVHNVTTARDLQAHRAGDARRRTSHGRLARNNLSTLQGLNAQPGVTVTVRADAGPPPARLQRIADQAAQSGDLRSRHPADSASCANAPWDELRVWDPGD